MLRPMIRSLLRMTGFDLVRVEQLKPHYGWAVLFELLKQRGFRPDHIMDIGANRGNWTRTALSYFPQAAFTMVEPQDELRSHVTDLLQPGKNIRWISAGASDAEGRLMMSSDGRDRSNTFLPTREQATAHGMTQFEVSVRTISEMLRTERLPIPDLIKIDAEGLDLKVFNGASDCWGQTEIFLLEAAVCAREFQFENTVPAVCLVLDAAGYELLDITDLNRSPSHGLLWLVELAFIRKGSRLLDGVRKYQQAA